MSCVLAFLGQILVYSTWLECKYQWFDTKPKEESMNAPNVSRQRWEILFDHNLGLKNQKFSLKGYTGWFFLVLVSCLVSDSLLTFVRFST